MKKKWSPWNWFKKEQEQQGNQVSTGSALPVQRYDEFGFPLMRLHREIDRMFDEAFRGFGFNMPSLLAQPSGLNSLFKPVVDIAENDKSYVISVEVPGVDEKDIQVQLEEDVLIIRGEKKYEQESEEENYHRIERSYGTFQRVLNLPDNANPESIKARFKNGVLTLTVEKYADAKPRKGRVIDIENA